MPIAQNKYPPQNHSAFLALAEEVERVKKMEGGVSFIVDLIEVVVESQGLVVVDRAEYESLSPGKVEGWREERERCHDIVMARAALWNEHAKVGHEGDCSMSLAEECEDIAEAIRKLPSPPISSRAEDSA